MRTKEEINARMLNQRRVEMIQSGLQKRLEWYSIESMEKDGTLNQLPALKKRYQQAKQILKKAGISERALSSLSTVENKMTITSSRIPVKEDTNDWISYSQQKKAYNEYLKKHHINFRADATGKYYTIYW